MKKLLFTILLGIAIPFNMNASNIPKFSKRDIPLLVAVATGHAIKNTFNKVKNVFKPSNNSRQDDGSCC